MREDVDLLDQFIVSATPTITSVSFADDGIADTFRIAPNGANVEVTVNGNIVVRKPPTELTSITIDGSGDDDTLIVDLGGLDASLGFAADLVVLDPIAGPPLNNRSLAATLIFNLGAGAVRHVMIAGAWRLWDRAAPGIAEAALAVPAAKAARRTWNRMANLPFGPILS